MHQKLFKGIYHFTLYAIGALILTAAVFVALIRLFLPDIGIYRGEVEAWVSQYMGYPVVIRSLDASWEGWVPHLQLGDIDLLNKAGTQPITHFDSAQIRIAPLATLVKRRIVPKQLIINGFEVAIARLSNGSIYIEGINVTGPEMSRLGDNELAEWLFKQEQIKIENGKIEWLDIKHQQKPILLSDVSLVLRSDGQRLQAEGSATLPEQYGKNMDFSFDAWGNLLSTEWSGELYLAGRDINPDHWYKGYRPVNFNVSGGNADINVWSTWEHAKLQSLEGDLQYDNFDTRAGENELHVSELGYRFRGDRIGEEGWQFHLNLHHLLTDNGNWPETNISISAIRTDDLKDYRYSASFNYLKLDDLSPFISNLTFLPETVKDKLVDITIRGELTQGKLIYNPLKDPVQRFRFDTRFNGINTDLGPEMPSLSNISGHLYGYLDKGVISLDAKDTLLKLKSSDKKTIPVNRVLGLINWNRKNDEWGLSTGGLELRNLDLKVQLSGNIKKFADKNSPFIDVIAHIGESNLEYISEHMPYTPRFKFRNWMRRSVLGGKLISANALFRGYISDFPFDENNGRFKLIVDATNATLDYSAFWPPVDNIDAEVIIDGREMQANIRNGDIYNARITSAKASMADIFSKKKSITIGGQIKGVTKDLSLFIRQSPLQKDPGLTEISRSLLSGDIALDLDLIIPIKQPEKKLEVTGNIKLSNTALKSSIKNLQLDNVEGDVNFTHYSVNSDLLSGSFYYNPVNLIIAGDKSDPDNLPSIKIIGMANEQFVADRLIEYFPALKSFEHYFRDRMLGEAEWSVSMTNVPGMEENKIVKKLVVESNLQGIHMEFPYPVGKPRNQLRPIKVTSYLGSKQNRNIQIKYDNILSTELLVNSNKKLHAINLRVGEGKPPDNSNPGLHISGKVDELVAAEWWNIIKSRTVDKNASGTSLIQSGIYLDLQVGAMELLHHQFPDVALSIRRPDKYWNFELDSEDIAGNIKIPLDRNADNLISFQLDKLEMNKGQQKSGGKKSKKLDPKNIPAIEGRVSEFIFNNFELGEMSLQTAPMDNGLSIEKITFEKPDLIISGSGDWIGAEVNDHSNFDIELHANKMEAMLTTFGYNQTPVKKGETKLQLNAGWTGTPMDFSLGRVKGSLDMQISKGQILDVNPSAGRLFGLFSLQTLSRRLTLDFSDIFGKGLAFDRIEGSFNIDNGNAYTNDLFMRAPAANIAISGRTGLSEQDYDQVVTVTPQFSDNLPVAGVLLGPVGIGIGAVFYLAGQMFDSVHDSIDKLLQYQYTITGSWHEPVIEKIKNRKNDQKLTEASDLAP